MPNQNKLIKDEFGDFQNYLFEEGSSGLFGEETPKKWKSHKQIILEYRKIFFFYKLFGDYGIAPKKIKKRLLKIFSSISQETIPGWYDTHAKHDNVI